MCANTPWSLFSGLLWIPGIEYQQAFVFPATQRRSANDIAWYEFKWVLLAVIKKSTDNLREQVVYVSYVGECQWDSHELYRLMYDQFCSKYDEYLSDHISTIIVEVNLHQ